MHAGSNLLPMKKIDLNCDMGESFGAYRLGNDEQIMHYVSSVNIACGFHAGDPEVIHTTVRLAKDNRVAIGAHPGFHDLQGFGRREIQMTPKEIYSMVLYQVGALYAFTRVADAQLSHVKPHGALYNQAARDKKVAEAIANAVCDFDKNLLFYGLSGSVMIEEARKKGLRCCNEVFADRTYQNDGTLTPRSEPGSLITDEKEALKQSIKMVSENSVTTKAGLDIKIVADTICIHGDGQHALAFAKAINENFAKNNVIIERP